MKIYSQGILVSYTCAKICTNENFPLYSIYIFITVMYMYLKHAHQLRGKFLEVCRTLLHVLLSPSESNDILLLPRLRKAHLDPVETITDLSNLLPLCPDDLLVKAMLDDDIFGALIFLRNVTIGDATAIYILHVYHGSIYCISQNIRGFKFSRISGF